ncbi:MAG: hypothetical protein KDM81_20835, partial [Verrucomicrobiae bacterium]|nr:hypothetical protein [Verrucomicrobiae bacterium]
TLHGPGTPTGFTLRNSLLVEIEAIPPHTEIHTEQVPDATGVFREEGAGHYYLPWDSPYRDAGTDQIDATLLADLRTLTTCPPAVHQEVTLSSPTEWNLRVERDLGAPDLGYHYPPLDLAIDTLTVVQGGSLKVGPGVAIGVFGCYGIVAEDFAQVSLVGNARDRVTLAHYTAVQEQSEPWSGSPFAPTLIYGPRHNVIAGHNSPDVALRFVDLSVLGGRGNAVLFLNNWASVRTLVARDCRFFGGYTHVASHASQLGAVNLSNNLFQRTVDDFFGWMHLTAANNLFVGGTSHFACYIMVPDTWTVSDNAFHETGVLGWRSYIHRANNAYLGEVSFTDPHWTTASDTTLSTFDYLPG